MRKDGVPVWLWPHALGLDAAFMAVCWQEVVARHWGVWLQPAERLVLFLIVLGIYLINRALGSPGAREAGLVPEVQAFAVRHRVVFLIAAFAAVCGAGVLVFTALPRVAVFTAAPVVVVALAYFVWSQTGGRNDRELRAKAVLSGVLFAVGVLLVPYAMLLGRPPDFFAVLAVLAGMFTAHCLETTRVVWIGRGMPPPAGGLFPAWGVAAISVLLAWALPSGGIFLLVAVASAVLALVRLIARGRPLLMQAALNAALLWPALAWVVARGWLG